MGRGPLRAMASLAALALAAALLRIALWHPLPVAGAPPDDGFSRVAGVVHVHTTLSDGGGEPGEVIRAARAAGLAFLGITDHNNLDAKPLEGYQDGVLVLVGAEISTPVGHLLGIGLDRDPAFRFNGDGQDAIDDVLHLGGVAVRGPPVLDPVRPALERLRAARPMGPRAAERRRRRPPRRPAAAADGDDVPPQSRLCAPRRERADGRGAPALGRAARLAGRRRPGRSRCSQPARDRAIAGGALPVVRGALPPGAQSRAARAAPDRRRLQGPGLRARGAPPRPLLHRTRRAGRRRRLLVCRARCGGPPFHDGRHARPRRGAPRQRPAGECRTEPGSCCCGTARRSPRARHRSRPRSRAQASTAWRPTCPAGRCRGWSRTRSTCSAPARTRRAPPARPGRRRSPSRARRHPSPRSEAPRASRPSTTRGPRWTARARPWAPAPAAATP